MKLFSNFDTKKKENILKYYQNEFGNSNVLIIQKSKLYRLIRIFLPLMWYLISELIIVLLSIQFVSHKYFLYFIIWFSILIFIIFIFPIIINYLEYTMDFLIVTPKEIIKYDQEWFFERDVQTMSLFNLKTISVKKKWILRSIFNNWDMTFLSEWTWDDLIWEITFHCVYKPEKIRHKISSIIKWQ